MGDSTDSTVFGIQWGSTRRGICIVCIGLCAVAYGAYDYHVESEAVREGVEVNATIVETGVDSLSGVVKYSPTATFEYTYHGESYTGTEVFPGPEDKTYDTESAARSVIDGYEPGDTVTAYVNPDSPGNGFLKKERTLRPFLGIAFGVFAIIGGLESILKP